MNIQYNTHQIEKTICSLYPLIEDQIKNNKSREWSEYSLRRELVACILGSQVRYEMATTALNHIEECGLLHDKWWHGSNRKFENNVFNVLSGRIPNLGRKWSYRFPKTRSHQLARARDALSKLSLADRLSQTCNPRELRQNLVADIAGLGPKQASMFLRNIGKSYELAILDTHILRFLDMQNLISRDSNKVSSLLAYEKTERIVSNYADKLGFRVGYLDWAIWATMRAASEIAL